MAMKIGLLPGDVVVDSKQGLGIRFGFFLRFIPKSGTFGKTYIK